jgi:DNA primase
VTISVQQLDEIRTQNKLSSVINCDIKLLKSGREYKACCPFHGEKTPSFYVNDEKSFYHCFGCGAHGDVIKWMADYRRMSFIDAVTVLGGGQVQHTNARPIQRDAVRVEPETVESIEVARSIWAMRQPIANTLAQTYLLSRGIPVERIAGYLENIWFAPNCPTRSWLIGKDATSVPSAPALICPIASTDGVQERQIGTHVTYLNSKGEKTGRKIYGQVQGGAVLLTSMRGNWPLLNGEGLESTLAGLALSLRGQPMFRAAATLSLNNHQDYPIMDSDGALPLHNPRYDTSRNAFGFFNPGIVWSLIDADMKPHNIKVRRKKGGSIEQWFQPAERTKLCSDLVGQKWMHYGATQHVAFEPTAGMDYNDMWRVECVKN